MYWGWDIHMYSALEGAERRLGEFWAAYEERVVRKRLIPTIKYPDRYSLKTDKNRIEEATKVAELMYTVPGGTVKRELAKTIVSTLLSGKVSVDVIDRIYKEVESANYTTSDPEVIIRSREAGLVGEQTASIALGFSDNEYLQAREDHMKRIERIKEAQSGDGDEGRAGARGLTDESFDPASEGREEKEKSRDVTMRDSVQKLVRGQGRDNLPKEE